MLSKERIETADIASRVVSPKNIENLKGAGLSIVLPSPVWDEETQRLYLRVGNQFFYSGKKRRTFHEMIIDHLNNVLGEDWISLQENLPLAERHFIYECFNETDTFFKEGGLNTRKETDEINSSSPNGFAQSLATLAFDIYLLKNAGVIDNKLLDRLKLKDQYQGARYEITVAATFIKAGWSIEWCKDQKGIKIPEFIATSGDSKYKMAVEAKSKQRDGVLHKEGVFDPANAEKGNMLYLFKEALGKETFGLPYAIFLDINSPQEVSKKDKLHWLRDLQALFDTVIPKDAVDKQNLVISTNFSPHYDGRMEASNGQYVYTLSLKSEHSIPEEYLWSILEAVKNAQTVPMLFPCHIS